MNARIFLTVVTSLWMGSAPAGAQSQPQPKSRLPAQPWSAGVFGGVGIVPEGHELYSTAKGVQRPLHKVVPLVGLRVGFHPLRVLSLELEGQVSPTGTAENKLALLYALRGHVVAQFPWRLTPHLLVGGGLLGVRSDALAVGSDVDAAFHWGGGFKATFGKGIGFRLDVRHVVSGKVGEGGFSHFVEGTAGLSFALPPGAR